MKIAIGERSAVLSPGAIADSEIESIREQLYREQQGFTYIVLVISASHFRIFTGTNAGLTAIDLSIPGDIEAYRNDIAERVTNFSDVADRREVMLDKFLRHIDDELDRVIGQQNVPLFVLGTLRTMGHYKKLSHHTAAIAAFIHGNYDEYRGAQLFHLLSPYITGLRRSRQEELLRQLSQAMDAGKLVWGMNEVWRHAQHGQGRLMAVEKDYHFQADKRNGDHKGHNGHIVERQVHASDALDLLINKVIETGGQVIVTDNGILDAYCGIALVLYY